MGSLMKRLFSLVMMLTMLAPTAMLTNCGSSGGGHELHLAAASELPMEMSSAPARVREAYQFAVANPDPLKNVPCFCGCNSIGHTNNYDCYIKDAPNNGKVVFDSHAIGCSICVDITQDVMRMTRDGRAPPQIRRAIFDQYTQFGPSNFPKNNP